MHIRDVREEDLTPDEQINIRTIFGDQAARALFDDLNKLKISIKRLDKKRSNQSDNNNPLDEKSAETDFKNVIGALKNLPTNALMIHLSFQEKLTTLKTSTDALKKKLELKGGWLALAILKKIIGTIAECLLYNSIILTHALSWGIITGYCSSILTFNFMFVAIGATIGAGYGTVKGIERAQQWTPKVSDYISSCMFALPSAYRADKANAIDRTVQQLQKRTATTPGQ